MANDFSRLEQEVQEDADVKSSAVTLLNGLSEQLRQFANDPAKITELADKLDQSSQSLADAIVANTPAA